MKAKPLWTEGMLMQQQHLQYWQRYLNEQKRESIRIAQPYAWGILDYAIDDMALQEHCFCLQSVIWSLLDGEIVSCTQPLSIELPHQKSSVSIYLTLPIASTLSNCPGYPSVQTLPRVLAKSLKQQDEYDSEREAEVMIAAGQ